MPEFEDLYLDDRPKNIIKYYKVKKQLRFDVVISKKASSSGYES